MKIALFDMDGTLTKPRGKINQRMVKTLSDLQKKGFRVGIVSGSDINYITDQCDLLFDDMTFDHTAALWFPCNGTKRYRYGISGAHCVYDHNMIDYLGQKKYKHLIMSCLKLQNYILWTTDCPITGTFFDYRGSMLNWCPIGRKSSQKEREAWKEIDSQNKVRKKWKKYLLQELKQQGIVDLTVKLGGDTSFDIFPNGWDKSFILSQFDKSDDIYFVGDKCDPSGNDFELYEAINHRNAGRAFVTDCPIKTINIIRNNILVNSDQI